ncbi:MAG: hypothetical protein L6R36_007980, partial [Xanthoria steineri]
MTRNTNADGKAAAAKGFPDPINPPLLTALLPFIFSLSPSDVVSPRRLQVLCEQVGYVKFHPTALSLAPV